jgi:hypothetical protein
MERVELESTSLKSVAYDEEALILEVEFVEGGVYQYSGVPREIYEQLIDSESKGRYYVENVRNAFPYKRVDDFETDTNSTVSEG